MLYTVERIDEDLDFGCEDRSDGDPVMAVVTMHAEDGSELVQKFEDAALINAGIEAGSRVYVDENGRLQKAAEGDWTKTCSTENVDLQKFTNLLQKARNEEAVDWVCPFCGGKVSLIRKDGQSTEIGCDSCDMRIQI